MARSIKATIGEYSDFHSESWVIEDGQWVWNESMFDSPDESARWKKHVAENGSVFGHTPTPEPVPVPDAAECLHCGKPEGEHWTRYGVLFFCDQDMKGKRFEPANRVR